jgi:hypothetical protein
MVLETLEQFERAIEDIARIKGFLTAAPTLGQLISGQIQSRCYLMVLINTHSIAAALPRRSFTVAKITSPTTKKNPVDNMANR